MSKTSQDPTKYHRAGIAIPLARKPELDARLAALGLKTVGELATLFIIAPGVIEALKPVADAFQAEQSLVQTRAAVVRRDKLIASLKDLPPKEMALILRGLGVTAAFLPAEQS